MVNTKDYKILVIEDDPSQQNLIDMIFKYSIKNDKKIDHSYNLANALKKIEEVEYNLIICDLRLPMSNSIQETVETIISNKNNSSVIFVTVENIDSKLLSYITNNGCKFVSKNVNFLNDIQKEITHYIK